MAKSHFILLLYITAHICLTEVASKKIHKARDLIPVKDERIDFIHNVPKGNPWIAFLNSTSNVAAVIDYSSNFTVILNGGVNASGLLVDTSTNDTRYFTTNKKWDSKQENFTVFLEGLGNNLQGLQQSPLTDIDAIGAEWNPRIQTLGVNRKSDRTALARSIIHLLGGPAGGNLSGLLVTNTTSYKIRGGVETFNSVLLGINDLFSDLQNGTNRTELIASLNLESIINSRNGIEALLKILRVLGEHNDLSRLFPKLEGNFFKIIVELGGHTSGSDNVNNVLEVIYIAVKVTRGEASVDEVIEVVVRVTQNGGVETDPSSVQHCIDDWLLIAQHQNSTNWGFNAVFLAYLHSWNDRSTTINGLRISELLLIISRANSTSPETVKVIVQFLTFFNHNLDPQVWAPRLFGHLLTQGLNSSIPGFNNTNPLGPLNLTNEIPFWRNGTQNLTGSPEQITVVFRYLSDCVRNSTNGTQDLASLINFGNFPCEITNALRGFQKAFQSFFSGFSGNNSLPFGFPPGGGLNPFNNTNCSNPISAIPNPISWIPGVPTIPNLPSILGKKHHVPKVVGKHLHKHNEKGHASEHQALKKHLKVHSKDENRHHH